MSSKPTPGPWTVEKLNKRQSPNLWIVAPSSAGICKIEPCDYDDGKGERLTDEDFANAALIAEAGTVHHETGLTPQQLREQRDELLALIKRIEANPATRVLMQHRTDMRAAIAKTTEGINAKL